jgi:5-methylcytosine-specific restriction endonuclease McrA
MGKRLPITPRSKVKNAIRQLFLRSRERAAAIKRDKYTCVLCGKKQSKAKGKEQKVECHHKEGIGNWEQVIDLIYTEILCDPAKLETLCPECHKKQPEDLNEIPF